MKLKSLFKEELNLSSVKTQLLALSKKYPGEGKLTEAFKKGDKVKYLGHPAVITHVEDKMGKTYYSVSYNKGTGKTKARMILSTDGSITEASETTIHINKTLGLEIVESAKPVVFQEAEYQGKKVKLGKVKRGGSRKFYVYVNNPKTGNVKKVSFGDNTGLSIKTKDPKKRKSFKARHKCDQKKDRTSAGYWSCRMWSGPDAVKNMLKK